MEDIQQIHFVNSKAHWILQIETPARSPNNFLHFRLPLLRRCLFVRLRHGVQSTAVLEPFNLGFIESMGKLNLE